MIRPTNNSVTDIFGNNQNWRDMPHSGTDFGNGGFFDFVAPESGTIIETQSSTDNSSFPQ